MLMLKIIIALFFGLGMPPPPPGMRPPFMPPVFMQRPTGPQTVFEKGPEIKKQPEKEGDYIF